ncbi:MAG: DUF6188 family protein [Dehalococcoidia bacterium]
MTAASSDNGTLSLEFDTGRAISVSPRAQFEAWEISLSDGRLWVCTPGGEVEQFHPVPRWQSELEYWVNRVREFLHL